MHILVANLSMTRLDGHDATAVLRGDVATGDPHDRGIDRDARHLLGHVDRLGDRLGRPVDLDDRSLADSP